MAEVDNLRISGGIVASAEVHDFGWHPEGIDFTVVVYCPVCKSREQATMTFADMATHYVCDVCHYEWVV